MNDLNACYLVGNLVRDPELRYTNSGTAVCEFTVATGKRTKANGEWKESTSFIDVVTWKQQAESSAEYLKKGRKVLVEGRISQDRWETKDGQKRQKVYVTASRVHFFDKAGSSSPEPDKEEAA